MKISTKKELALVTTIIFLTLAFTPAADSSIISTSNAETSTQDDSGGSILDIDASSSYDYGLKAGRVFKSQYRIMNKLATFSKQRIATNEDIKDQINYIKEFYPAYLEELRGLSDSTGIHIERLMSLKNLFDSTEKCTVTLSTGPATKNNQTFLTHNVDLELGKLTDVFIVFMMRSMFSHPWIKKQYSDYPYSYRYVCWGIPIIFEQPLMNEKGLSCEATATAATINKSRYIDTGQGIPLEMLRALTMRTCKNVSEVAKLWTSMERKSALIGNNVNDVYCWCDTEGGILIIEESHNYILTVFGNSTDITKASEGILWHANVHQWLDANLTGSQCYGEEGPSKTSFMRILRARELLEKNYGNITLDTCKNIIRDHGGGYDSNRKDSGDICHHSDKNLRVTTEFAYIIEPKEMTIYMTHRSPCKSIFWRYDISKRFGHN